MAQRWASALLVSALVVGGCKAADSPPPEDAAYAAAVSKPTAPPFTLVDTSGRPASLKDYKGQVVMLDFWATWCPPCRESIPVLRQLQKDYEGRGFQVLGINLDADPSVVSAFMKRQNINYTVLLGGESEVGDLYRVRGIPTMYLLNQQGEVARRWVGFDPSFADEWRKAIDGLLTS